MIVTQIQHIFHNVREGLRTKVYKTFQDPKTFKEYTTCEVFTDKGVMQNVPVKGTNVDKKV